MGITRDNRTKRRATGGKKKHFRNSRKLDMGRQPTLTRLGERKTTLVRMRGGKDKVRAIRLDAGNFGWGTEAIARKSRILRVTYNPTSNELVRTNTLVKNSIIQIDATPFRQWYEQHYGVQLGKARRADAPVKEVSKEEKAKALLKKAKLSVRKTKVLKNKLAKKEALAAKAGEGETAGEEDKAGEKDKAGDKKKKEKKPAAAKPAVAKPAAAKPAAAKPAAAKPATDKKRKAHLNKKGKELPHYTDSAKRQRQAVKARVAPIDQHLADQFLQGRLYACISSRPGQDGVADGYVLEGKELEFYLKKMQKKKNTN